MYVCAVQAAEMVRGRSGPRNVKDLRKCITNAGVLSRKINIIEKA